MEIKIVDQNRDKIESLLAKIAGKAQSNVLDARYVFWLAEKAELQLQNLGLPKSRRTGAVRWYGTDGATAKSYRYSRICMDIKILRKGSGWYLSDVQVVSRYPQQDGPNFMYLTSNQLAIVTTNFIKENGLQELR